MAEAFPSGFTPGRDETTDDPRVSRPYLRYAHNPDLGMHVSRARVPSWPTVLVVPGKRIHRTVPDHFRSYTETADGEVWVDAGPTWEEAKYNLRLRLENRGYV